MSLFDSLYCFYKHLSLDVLVQKKMKHRIAYVQVVQVYFLIVCLLRKNMTHGVDLFLYA